MAKTITMKDIADQLNISKVTVSKALSDKEGVSDALKAKIKLLAGEMGYRYNASAQAIKSGFSFNIGVVVAEKFTGGYHSFYLTFYQEVTRALDKYKYSSIFQVLSDEDEQNLLLPRCYQDQKVDGLIVLGQVTSEYIEVLNGCDVPIVFLDFYEEHTEVDTVVSDNFFSAYELTNYLIANKHRNIAFVGTISSTSSIQDRYLGYYKSLLEHKLMLDKNLIIDDRDEKGQFINLVIPNPMPTAFVCNCDRVAYELINQLQAKGYKIPEDVSIVSFDNDIYSTLPTPQITTVDVNMAEMTATVAEAIMNKIENPERRYGRMLVKGNIIYRDSVRNLGINL
ncbi:MAG: LacI family DNA-binding transcriptional regulator [Vallitaleaceae bacterium]|nr:LacI family DNA-binding transcriptional regulator [Vallitaleaceae bacterium]